MQKKPSRTAAEKRRDRALQRFHYDIRKQMDARVSVVEEKLERIIESLQAQGIIIWR